MLRAVGVDLEDIARDYALTDAYLRETYAAELAQVTDETERAQLAEEQRAKPEYILETLAELEERHGSVAAYLQAQGVSAQTLEQLKTRLVQTA